MSDYVKPQPKPIQNDSRPVWPILVAEFRRQADLPGISEESRLSLLAMAEEGEARDAFGLAKYGVRLGVECAPRDAAVDAYQEALDGLVYWRQEWERTKDPDVGALYEDAHTLTVRARRYLLKRDGK